MGVEFPIFVFERDDRSMRLVESSERFLYHLEAIDIENGEAPPLQPDSAKRFLAPFNIIGVTEPNFFGLTTGSNIDVWVPLSTQPLVEPNLDPKVSMFTARLLFLSMLPNSTHVAAVSPYHAGVEVTPDSI